MLAGPQGTALKPGMRGGGGGGEGESTGEGVGTVWISWATGA
jgi:hypothetical protein